MKRLLMHIPVGIINVALVAVNPFVGAIFAYAFIFYEKNEDRHLKDQAWHDVVGYLWGLAIGGGLLWLKGKVL